MKPVFLLGVGAQKSGTSWLHSSLNNQPYANFGFEKEYHIWDAVFSPLCSEFRADAAKNDTPKRALRRLMQTEDGVYEAYFRSLIAKNVCLTGDITPSYSLLSAEHYAHIKQIIERAGFDLKVIFLMRDPVDRVWSAIRMRKRRLEENGDTLDASTFIDGFLEHTQKPQNFERGRYDKTIKALEDVFDSQQLHYEFYERLFTKQAVKKLGDFLGFEISGVDLREKVNASQQIKLPRELRLEGKDLYSETYAYCETKFPFTSRLWQPPMMTRLRQKVSFR